MNLTNLFRKTKIKTIFLFLITISAVIVIIYYYYNKKSKVRETNISFVKSEKFIGIFPDHEKLPAEIQSSGNVDEPSSRVNQTHLEIIPEKYNEHVVKTRIIKEKIKNMMSKQTVEENRGGKGVNITIPVLKNIHIFYYAPVEWYKPLHNPQLTSSPSTSLSNISRPATRKLNIHFYPLHGIYDSSNLEIISKHFSDIKKMGIGTLVLTWTPKYPVNLLMRIFDSAISHDLRISIQIDNYLHRSADSIRNDIRYFMDNLGLHSGLNKMYIISKKNYYPVFYVKDITQVKESDWNKIFARNGEQTIRGTFYDSIMIGHITLSDHKMFIRRSNFDGFYTCLPSNGATYTSTWKNWIHLKKFSDSYKLIFIPTVGPGYDEKKKQPRAGMLRRHRSGGNYYGVAWRTALSLNPKFISIASFNNWSEGSQIEQAVPNVGFKDYLPGTPNKYLDLTQQYIIDFIKLKETNLKHNFYCDNFLNNTIC